MLGNALDFWKEEYRKALREAEEKLKENPADFKSLREAVRACLYLGDAKGARKFFPLPEPTSPQDLFEYYFTMGMSFTHDDMPELAAFYLGTALSLAESNHLPTQMVHREIAALFLKECDCSKELIWRLMFHMQKALRLEEDNCRKVEMYMFFGEGLLNLARRCESTLAEGDRRMLLRLALEYFRKAHHMLSDFGAVREKVWCDLHTGYAYLEMGDLQRASAYMGYALRYFKIWKKDRLEMFNNHIQRAKEALRDINFYLWELYNLGEIYITLKDYERAEETLNDFFSVYEEVYKALKEASFPQSPLDERDMFKVIETFKQVYTATGREEEWRDKLLELSPSSENLLQAMDMRDHYFFEDENFEGEIDL